MENIIEKVIRDICGETLKAKMDSYDNTERIMIMESIVDHYKHILEIKNQELTVDKFQEELIRLIQRFNKFQKTRIIDITLHTMSVGLSNYAYDVEIRTQ